MEIRRLLFLVFSAVLLTACGVRIDPTGDRCPGDGTLHVWDELLLSGKAAEDGPSARWYYCERDLDPGVEVDEARGWAGPIVNLPSGAPYGESKWVRVLSDDVALISRVGGVPVENEAQSVMVWRWAAQAKATFTDATTDNIGSLRDVHASVFFRQRAGAGGLPVDWDEDFFPRNALAAWCLTVPELRDRLANYPGCRYPDPREEPKDEPEKNAPPGAEPPDRGGIDVPPGTTPGGSGDEGER